MPTSRRRLVQLAAFAVPGLVLATRLAEAQPPVKKLRILILGGTGFTGPHQVAYALARGHTVTIFNRGREANPWPGHVEELIGDRNSGDLKALQGREWDVCIDNPTTLPFWVRDAGQVLGGKVGQYIFISTISVYASNAAPADEAAPTLAYAGQDPMAETAETLAASKGALYGPLKAVSEQEAERRFPGRTTVIRPGLIVGPGDETDRFTYWPVRLARGGFVLAPGETDPVQFIDARDLAEWTIRMAEQRTLGVFNATGPAHAETMRDMLSGIGIPIRSDAHLTWVSTAFLRAQTVSPWSDLPVWVPGQGDTAGFARRDIGKALAAGLTFRPLPITAVETLAWFRTLPAERQAKLRAGLTPEREAELLAKWRAAPDARG
ncbi:MAG TPA: NAD-dependent epimerase/dehydratase family protein [Caulobacteraceae bacterium]|jgi:2'-hydroxyisoflavone reductase|nr:NAD-dependent epimerase/dehydratase family protein [Caulobacteraceae bacterium]